MPPIIPVRLYAELEDILVVHIKIVLCMYHVTTDHCASNSYGPG